MVTSLLGDPHSDGVAVPKPERRAGRKHGHYGPGPVHREAVTFPNCWGGLGSSDTDSGINSSSVVEFALIQLILAQKLLFKKKKSPEHPSDDEA